MNDNIEFYRNELGLAVMQLEAISKSIGHKGNLGELPAFVETKANEMRSDKIRIAQLQKSLDGKLTNFTNNQIIDEMVRRFRNK